jgi:Spy/CpxP family protein refolding chaperone
VTPRRSSLSAGIYLFLVFLSGVLVGAFAYRLYMAQTVSSAGFRPRTPEEYRRHYIEEMQGRLKLNTEQVGKLQKIMDETGQRVREIREKDRPFMKAIEEEQRGKVRAMLTDPQRAEYEHMLAERERKRQQKKQ